MQSELPRWADSTGWPTLHAIESALQVALILGPQGALQVEATESYWKRSGGGTFGPVDFGLGEQLLVDSRIVERRDQSLIPLVDLQLLLDGAQEDAIAFITSRIPFDSLNIDSAFDELRDLIPDTDRRASIVEAVSRKYDDALMRIVGQIGEELVVAHCRKELRKLGQAELARSVRQISLENDGAGYDILAPRISGTDRMLEVKATTSNLDPVTFFLSRNEAMVGMRNRNWSLVVCVNIDVQSRDGEILGWFSGSQLTSDLPQDAHRGTWQSARLSIPRDELNPGIPSPIQ